MDDARAMFDEDAERLLESLPGPVIAVSLDGEVIAVNESTAIVTGLPREQLQGADLADLESERVFGAGTADRYAETVADLRGPGEPEGHAEIRVSVRLGGEGPARPFDAQIGLHPADDPDGAVWSLSAVDPEERYDETIEALHSATRTLMSAETTREAYDICGRAANEILGVPGAGVREFDPDRRVLDHVSFGGRVDNIDSRPAFDVHDSPHGEAFRKRETIVKDVPEDGDPYNREVFNQAMYVPISYYGVLSMGKMQDTFDEADVRFAEILAENTAAALDSIERRERLREQRRELQRRNKRLEQVASILAHDLESPIELAKGALRTYREDGDESYGDTAMRALDRLNTIVADVLSLARQGGGVEETSEVDLGPAARQAWTTVATGDTTLVTERAPTVEADRTRVLRLLENLFDNAVRHGDADEVAVRAAADGFCVVDDGAGIDEAVADSAFEAGVSTAESGSGLGLTIVEDIAAAHGWTVEIGASEDGGTRVAFSGVTVHEGARPRSAGE
jgi:signal transduction histidine kinase